MANPKIAATIEWPKVMQETPPEIPDSDLCVHLKNNPRIGGMGICP